MLCTTRAVLRVQVVSFVHDSISPRPPDADDADDDDEAAVPRWAIQDVRSHACSSTCMHTHLRRGRDSRSCHSCMAQAEVHKKPSVEVCLR